MLQFLIGPRPAASPAQGQRDLAAQDAWLQSEPLTVPSASSPCPASPSSYAVNSHPLWFGFWWVMTAQAALLLSVPAPPPLMLLGERS